MTLLLAHIMFCIPYVILSIMPKLRTLDPNIAEAVMQVEKGEEDESETVKQVFEKGYKLKDKIIRYAKVCVVK